MPPRLCLATVSDETFATGTEVLLHSFLRYNPWFSGDVVVFADALSQQTRARLSRLHPVRFEAPDPRLVEVSADLQARHPALSAKHLRFLSLEAFRLSHYDRVLFCDSDIYCAGDVSALFSRDEPFLASDDGYTYEDRLTPLLRANGYGAIASETRYGRQHDGSSPGRTFSSGVMALSPPWLGEATYTALLETMAAHDFTGERVFTDQAVLNTHVRGRYTTVSGAYNYRVLLEDYIRYAEDVPYPDARLIHFAGTIKPWNDYAPADLAAYDARYFKYIDVWRQMLEDARKAEGANGVGERILAQLALTDRDAGVSGVPGVMGRVW
ncbi:glycosyltransferase family 8 protein [Ferruginivarius sediminum]|uniref:Glycosyl transferase n=1 Tax=Ferruginivarius sediminum TaxID=2661937 RepID=A0A369TAI9_9PROT|nr:glycosyltransferase [Ferruginivarius sediminum]RDD61882.1 hypothetical protein DRB17_10345 [Ferruginivarius sediminum]